jgi:hypothetical protein
MSMSPEQPVDDAQDAVSSPQDKEKVLAMHSVLPRDPGARRRAYNALMRAIAVEQRRSS